MRTQTSHPYHPGMLRQVALSAVLVCAGWLTTVTGAAAQDVAAQGAEPVQAALDGAQPAGVAASVDASTVSSTPSQDAVSHVAADSQATPVQTAAGAVDTPASNDDSVNVADSTSSKKVFVTSSAAVTRYDMASLDDHVLDKQHGRAVGMLMVAAVPDSMRSNSVTLWDEIAPPTQTPQPSSDAARAAQSGNIVNYSRK